MTGLPIIPKSITVHLGPPDSAAENVTVPFIDYIKNVASSEIYPTWPENALRANIYAQISFALNRVYTEWYRSKGYDFDITNSTAYDQSFVRGRNVFENISNIVNEIFNNYIRRSGYVEPLFAVYCDGINTTCNGLSQWGSVSLAESGYTPYEILQNYYGDDIEIVYDAEIQDVTQSYPGVPLRLGSSGDPVRRIQVLLNRISLNYPLIPKINNVNGLFGVETEDAVKKFQQTFNLSEDGVVGKGTWYQIIYIYSAVKRLAEVDSEGQTLEDIRKQYKVELREGDRGDAVKAPQYYLNLISVFNNAIPQISVDGIYGSATRAAVEAYQSAYGLPVTGTINEETWNSLTNTYLGIVEDLSPENIGSFSEPFPGEVLRRGSSGDDVRTLQGYLAKISEYYPSVPGIPITGYFGDQTENAVIAFQNDFGIAPSGVVGVVAWNAIAEVYSDIVGGEMKNAGQYPGYTLSEEAQM